MDTLAHNWIVNHWRGLAPAAILVRVLIEGLAGVLIHQ